MTWARLVPVAVLVGGCGLLTTEDRLDHRDPFTGTVTIDDGRFDGEVIDYVGYSVWEDEWFPSFDGGPSALAFVETSNGPMTTFLEIPMDGWEEARAANAMEWPVVDFWNLPADVTDYRASVSWVEWKVTSDSSDEDKQLYRSVFNEGTATALSGTLSLTDTDWETFVDGRLQATLTEPDYSTREIDITFAWGGREEE